MQLHKLGEEIMASIREVAKLAHVAPSTVSRALNGSGYVSEKSKNKIKKAVEELDYIPNQWIRNLYKKRTGIIGVMTPDIIHPYFSTLWNYLEAELDQYGYNVVICNTRGNQDKEREYLDTLERNRFDGLIVGSAFLSDEYYMNIEKPIISLDRIIPGIPLVTSDHHQGGILAGELFLEKGCKKVMCFSDPTRMELASADSARALIDVMEKHNREVIIESFQWEEVINYQLCMKRTRTLLDQYPDVDGIMALDLCAAAFLKTEKNKKILAYDGTYVTDFNYHSIDSIVQDAKKVAKESVNMLIKLINDQPLKKREVLVPVKYKKGDTL